MAYVRFASKSLQGETSIHVHHIVAQCMWGGDRLDNLVMLHPNCHRQIHSLMKLGADTGLVSTHLTAGAYKGLSRMRGNSQVRFLGDFPSVR